MNDRFPRDEDTDRHLDAVRDTARAREQANSAQFDRIIRDLALGTVGGIGGVFEKSDPKEYPKIRR